jgi:hypothetical protein
MVIALLLLDSVDDVFELKVALWLLGNGGVLFATLACAGGRLSVHA